MVWAQILTKEQSVIRLLSRIAVTLALIPLLSCGDDKATNPEPRDTWEVAVGGADDERGYAIVPLSNGDYMTAGDVSSSGVSGADVFLTHLSASGYEVWERTYGGETTDRAFSLISLPEGESSFSGRHSP